MMISIDPLWLITGIGSIVGGVIGAGVKKIWVWGWVYADKEKDLDEMIVDRDFWRDTALGLLGHAKALEPAVVKGTKGE